MGAGETEYRAIGAAIQAADRPHALDLAMSAWAKGGRQPLVLMLAAERLEELGRPAEAIDLLRSAATVEKDEPELWRRLGTTLCRHGLFEEGAAALEEALDFDPDDPDLLAQAGNAHFQAGGLAAARTCYADAAALQPGNAAPLAALAAISVREGDAGMARQFATRALALAPGEGTALLALARADLAQDKAGDAIRRVDGMLRGRAADESVAMLLDLRAEAFDRLDATDRAFADYAARNRILDRLHGAAARGTDQESRIDQALRLRRHFEGGYGHRKDAIPASRPHGPVRRIFLVGFPRSGTTLLEKALAGHPGIVSLPEIDCLPPEGVRLLDDDAGLARLARLEPEALDHLRRSYEERVAGYAGAVEGKAVLDKMPLHAVMLPLIAALFPDAGILLAIRDPRDVVLSCFRRRFQINSAMIEFLDLERTARFYDAVMRLMAVYREALPLDVKEIRHEDVVADFEGEMRGVLSFLGLQWEAGVGDFAARAAARIRTPSDLQLMRGLNADGVGQWRRYERQLGPVLGMLDSWVERFGYRP